MVWRGTVTRDVDAWTALRVKTCVFADRIMFADRMTNTQGLFCSMIEWIQPNVTSEVPSVTRIRSDNAAVGGLHAVGHDVT